MVSLESATIERNKLLITATAASEALLRKAVDVSEKLFKKATETSEVLRHVFSEDLKELRADAREASDELLLAAFKASKDLHADSAEASQLLLCTAAELADTDEADENARESIVEAAERAKELLSRASEDAKILIVDATDNAVNLVDGTALAAEQLRFNVFNDFLVELRSQAKVALIEITPEEEAVMMSMGSNRLVRELQVQKLELGLKNEELQNSSAELEKRQEYFADFYDSSPTGFVSIDRNGAINHINIICAQLLRRKRSQLTGAIFASFVTMGDLPAFNIFLQQLFESGMRQSCMLSLKDRKQAPLCVQMLGTLSPDKQTCRAVLIDLTEQRQIENQLHQSQKIESLGRLAGGVAHDYNNMLSVIIGNVELAQMKIERSAPLNDNLGQILQAANRSRDITRQLLAFARKQIISPKVLDFNVSLENMLNMLRNLLGENIDLAWHPKEGSWLVKVDPSQLDQVLANLCINARDAIAETGKMTVETDTVNIDEDYCKDHPGFILGSYVVLSVSDNGCGMDKETLDNVFEPFFTTKQAGEGTGLGLATVYGIVKQSGGFINVYSEPNQGTTFKIYLPRHEGENVVSQETTFSEIQKGKGETVLLVEDELAIVELTTAILEDLGYRVLAANSPEEVLNLLQEYQGDIHILLTDVVMPEMNGRELAKQVRETYPRIKTLFMSGYTADVIAHHGVLDEGINFIQKPFSRFDLSARVREVLDFNA